MDREYDLMDILNVLSLIIGIANYQENLTQDDKQDLMKSLNNQTRTLLIDIHSHLDKQDKMLEELTNDKDKKTSRRNVK